jgi:predicted TIM-barrel fold metal-dependent hydrolase
MKGIKLHFGNAGVSLRNPDHVTRMQQVFSLAQRLRVPVLIHMRARGGTNYGAEDASLFLDKILPSSPDIEIIVAHFGGAGPGYPPQSDEVMGVFATAAKWNDRRLHNVYFDMATVVTSEATAADVELIAKRIREVGVGRVLYGSDLSPPGGGIREGWEIFEAKVPLTPAELQRIARNRPRFAR